MLLLLLGLLLHAVAAEIELAGEGCQVTCLEEIVHPIENGTRRRHANHSWHNTCAHGDGRWQRV
jgi:hypothetical protein